MQERRLNLHPFSRQVALVVGGLALVAATLVFIQVRRRVPTAEALGRRVKVVFALPGEAAFEAGGRVPAGRPVEVRFRHDLGRSIGLVAVAVREGGAPVWWVPGSAAEGPLQVRSAESEKARVGASLAPGRWQLVSLVGVAEGRAGEWLTRWQAGDGAIVGRVIEVTVE